MAVIRVSDGVSSLFGTANQVILTGTGVNALASGTDVTLSTPQNIDSAANVTHGTMKLGTPIVTAGSGAGITVNDAGEVREQVYKVTTTFSAYSAAAKTGDVTLCTLPAKSQLVAVYSDTTTPYTGGGESAATLKIGLTAGAAEIIASHDVFTAAITAGLLDADMGTSMTRAAQIQGCYPGAYATTKTLVARLTTTTNNTSSLTAGSTTFYIVVRVLP